MTLSRVTINCPERLTPREAWQYSVTTKNSHMSATRVPTVSPPLPPLPPLPHSDIQGMKFVPWSVWITLGSTQTVKTWSMLSLLQELLFCGIASGKVFVLHINAKQTNKQKNWLLHLPRGSRPTQWSSFWSCTSCSHAMDTSLGLFQCFCCSQFP